MESPLQIISGVKDYEPSYERNICLDTITRQVISGAYDSNTNTCTSGVLGDILKFHVIIKHIALGSEKLAPFNVNFTDQFRYSG